MPPKTNPVDLRKDKISKADANFFSGLDLDESRMDEIPDQIRQAMLKRLVRVVDLFKQFDDDNSGTVSGAEFGKAMSELGLRAPPEAVAAVFASFDPDGNGTITYQEMHTLLVRSIQETPHLEPLSLRATNAVGLRTEKVSKVDANLFGGLDLDESRMDQIPDQIRQALKSRLTRVIDLFRQFDDDCSGTIDLSEFTKAMNELGLQAPPEALSAVFASFDGDNSGAIVYTELHDILVRSFQNHPDLPPLDLVSSNTIALRKKKVRKQDAMLFTIDLDESPGAPSYPDQLVTALEANKARMIDLFRQFDDDASGYISRKEFVKAMIEMGLETTTTVLHEVFAHFDPDGSGDIAYDEMRKRLKEAEKDADHVKGVMEEGVILRDPDFKPYSPEGPAPPAKNKSGKNSRNSKSNSRPATSTSGHPGEVGSTIDRPATDPGSIGLGGIDGAGNRLPKIKKPMGFSEKFRRMIREYVPPPLPLRRVSIPIAAEYSPNGMAALEAWEIASPGQGTNRASRKLAILTHALGMERASSALPNKLLHRMLYDAGYSVLVFEGHPIGPEVSEQIALERLRAVFAYVETHSKFCYCRVALLAQGTCASVGIQISSKYPELVGPRLAAMSVCQPSGIMNLVSSHVPKSRVPCLISYAEEGAAQIPLAVMKAIPEDVPSEILVAPKGVELYGKARRFAGDAYFAQSEKTFQKLVGFLSAHL